MNLRLVCVCAAITASGCATQQEATSSPPSETTSESSLPDGDPALAHRLVEREDAVLLDVRTPEEFDTGHIEGATNISHDELSSRLDEVEKLTGGDQSQPIVVYCRSGSRAGQAKQILLEAGYERVTNLGDVDDW